MGAWGTCACGRGSSSALGFNAATSGDDVETPLAKAFAPWAEEADVLDQLVVDGRVRRGTGGLLAVRPLKRPVFRAGSEALAEERAERM